MSNEQKKNTSQSRRPRQSSTQKSKDGSDKKRSHSKPRVEWKLHPVAEEKDLASNILKNTDMDIDLDEINLLLRSVDKQTPAEPAADSRLRRSRRKRRRRIPIPPRRPLFPPRRPPFPQSRRPVSRPCPLPRKWTARV